MQLGKLNILIHIFGGIAGIAVMFALSNVQSMAVQNANADASQTVTLDKSLSKETKLPDQKTPFGFIKTLQAACLPRHFFHNLLAIRPSLLPWIKPVFISSSFSFLSFFFLPFLINIHFRLLSCESPRAPPRRSVVSF